MEEFLGQGFQKSEPEQDGQTDGHDRQTSLYTARILHLLTYLLTYSVGSV